MLFYYHGQRINSSQSKSNFSFQGIREKIRQRRSDGNIPFPDGGEYSVSGIIPRFVYPRENEARSKSSVDFQQRAGILFRNGFNAAPRLPKVSLYGSKTVSGT